MVDSEHRIRITQISRRHYLERLGLIVDLRIESPESMEVSSPNPDSPGGQGSSEVSQLAHSGSLISVEVG